MTQSHDLRQVEQPRLNALQAAPEAMKAMLQLSAFVEAMDLEHSLKELVKIRASQINGCANCLAMHTRDARAHGESDERMHLVSAWHEAPVFTPRERAALAWTDALTLLSQTKAPAEVYEAVAAEFSEKEVVELTLAINVINSWNRFAVGFRVYQPEAGIKAKAA